MEFDEIRPIITGTLGGLVAIVLGNLWLKRAPRTFNGKSREWLTATYRHAIFVANALLATGAGIGIALYPIAGFANSDWKPLGLGFGGGCLAALLALSIIPLLTRGSPRDAYAAYAISQRTPQIILYPILILGITLFFFAFVSG